MHLPEQEPFNSVRFTSDWDCTVGIMPQSYLKLVVMDLKVCCCKLRWISMKDKGFCAFCGHWCNWLEVPCMPCCPTGKLPDAPLEQVRWQPEHRPLWGIPVLDLAFNTSPLPVGFCGENSSRNLLLWLGGFFPVLNGSIYCSHSLLRLR